MTRNLNFETAPREQLIDEIRELRNALDDAHYELKRLPIRLIAWLADGGCEDAVLCADEAIGYDGGMPHIRVWSGDPEVLAKTFDDWECDQSVAYFERKAEGD